MSTITIPQKEHKQLAEKAFKFEYLREIINSDVFAPPSIKNMNEIIEILKNTKKYSKKFIANIENGMRRSAYFK
ncbi:MAG: hypothetical protein AAB371_00615 [Patescibacteria group bacterium]